MLNENTITAQKVRQNNQEFFVSTFTIGQLLKFTKYTERLIVSYDEENRPIYNNEIQRKVEQSRVDKIADFLIKNPDAIFPTNLVIAIPSAILESISSDNGNIYNISLSNKVFEEIRKSNGDVFLTIIDGQHRIRGIEKAIELLRSKILNLNRVLEGAKHNTELTIELDRYGKLLDHLLNIDLIVTFFIDPTLEFQAMIFSTINRTQKSVSQSLVYSLFGLTESDSPQKTALKIVLALNSFEQSPFYNRIRLYGGTYGRNQSPALTQAMMVKSIIDLICINAREAENDRFRNRKDLLNNLGPRLPFRKYYAKNQDDFITDILFSFFTAVRKTFSKNGVNYWDMGDAQKNILQTTVGYQALLDIMIDILNVVDESVKDKIETYEKLLVNARMLNLHDTSRYPFTSKSRKIFYYDLSLAVFPPIDKNDERLKALNEYLGSVS